MKISEMEGWQKKKLAVSFLLMVVFGMIYLISACSFLYRDKVSEKDYWEEALTPTRDAQVKMDLQGETAVRVLSGTYVENLKELNLKSSYYKVDFQIWFRWEGSPDLDMANHFRIYKGTITKKEMIKDYHKGGDNYQIMRVEATVSKNFWTNRFPLESHQLRFYVEPDYTAREVVLEADVEHSSLNDSMSVSGYRFVRHAIGTYALEYDSTHSDPEYNEGIVKSELVTAIEINRDSWGLYVKCFIALVGTISWVMITLFINTFHRVDPLGMIPAALFGTVSNIMVGANLIPDALTLGLLEFVNIYGVVIILTVAMVIININRIRNKWEDRDFAKFYGRVMFYTLLVFIIAGNIALPVSAYLRA